MLTVPSPAKLNLILEVLGKRPDGYHEIRSLVQTINLCDTLSFELASDISLKCTEPALQTSDNLIIRAANLLKKVCSYKGGTRIILEKRIPLSSGLGGGSSNAEATLIALNKHWELGITTSELLNLAAQLGSDVPFFIHKGAALVEGRGEGVTPLPPAPSPIWFVLLLPTLPIMTDKTKQAYTRLKEQHFTSGQFIARAREIWANNKKLKPTLLFNVFDSIAFDIFPELNVYWNGFEQAGATNIHLAGSGPTLFTLAADKNSATELHQLIREQSMTSIIVSSTAAPGR